jgi:hypothetical protein
MTRQPLESANPLLVAEIWATQLREHFIQDGYDQQQVDELIGATLARFRSARVRDFVPLLVERSVRRALNGDRNTPTTERAVPAGHGDSAR